jgi:hypothetical protein
LLEKYKLDAEKISEIACKVFGKKKQEQKMSPVKQGSTGKNIKLDAENINLRKSRG